MSVKQKEGTWVTLEPGVKQMLDMILGLTRQPRTQYIRHLVEDDLVNKLQGVDGIENIIGMKDATLVDRYKELKQRVADRKSGFTEKKPTPGAIEKQDDSEKEEAYETVEPPPA